tara:strand:- start:554 stop:1327 length:774 start_codon:yes stop_codon:yes gene_type:complete
MIDITVNLDKFKEAVEAIWLKGKYKSSTVSKIDSINNLGVIFLYNDNTITLANANDTIAASVTLRVYTQVVVDEEKMMIFDIEKLNKYLKVFKSDRINIRITDAMLSLSNDDQTARMQMSIEHSNLNAILKIQQFSIPSEGMPTFGKTLLDTKISIQGTELAKAIKHCNIVGTATFKFDYNGTHLKVSSSNFHQTEHFDCFVPMVSHEGEPSTVEFSAPLDKFCQDGVMFLYLKDDKPVLLIGPNRKLVVAPYIRAN